MSELKKNKKYLGYLQDNGSNRVYQICYVSITSKEIILNTLTSIVP